MNKLYLKLKEFDNRNNRNQRLNYYLIYTGVFILVSVLCYFWFYIYNKSMVWNGDGIKQHYNSLIYFGEYLREIIKNFLGTGRLEIPLWDSNIGLGTDIITALQYYVFGDPLNLLSVFVPPAKTEYLYSFLIILRLFLAGIGFSCYCRFWKKGRFATLCGALVYVFCSYAIFVSTFHPFFLNPMIYFPLLLIGVEKIFAQKKPFYFIIMVFISAVSNFYFFYMLSILVFLYAIIRFFFIYRDNRLRNFGLCLRNFCFYYVIGVFLACIILLPSLVALFSSKRFSNDIVMPLFYNIKYYKDLLFGIIEGRQMEHWTFIGSSVVVLPALALMFMHRKKYNELKIPFIVLGLFLIFPFVGHLMNGFSYVSNRWTWGVSFLLAFILTTMLPELLKITKSQFFIILALAVTYLLTWYIIQKKESILFLGSWIILAISIFIFGIASLILKNNKNHYSWWKGLSYSAVLITIIVGIAIQSASFYARPKHMNSFVEIDKNYTKVANIVAKEIQGISDKDFYRFELSDKAKDKNVRNSAMVNGINSLDYYLSIGDANISEFLIETASSYYLTFAYKSFDNRSNLTTPLNVKYQIAEESQYENLFYGYEPYKTFDMDGTSYQIYKNQYALPFGYTYSTYMPRREYENLEPLKKQQVMMQAAAVDTESIKLDQSEIEYTDEDIPFDMKCLEGVSYKDGEFIVENAGASVEVTFKGLPDSENYLLFDNLQYAELKEEKNNNHLIKTAVTVRANNISRVFSLITPYYRSYEGREDYVFNMCYSKAPLNKMKFTFRNKGRYSVDKIRVVNQSMENYKTQVNQLKEDYLKNVSFSTNKITGNIELNSNKLLCLSIPYSKGWQAYVDGEKVEILKTNTIFSGIMLEEGNHSIELRYFTPGLKIGIICFGIGLILLFIEIIYWNRAVRKKQ